jgi:hypothetical protein
MKAKVLSACAFAWILVAGGSGARSAPGEEEKAAKKSWNFDEDKSGILPKGFTGEAGEWKVVADGTAPSKGNAFAQSAKSSRSTFNLVLVNDASFTDVDISVKMKAIAGAIDQGGGVVWRAKDAKNYYIARYNPLEENLRVYKVEDGNRSKEFQSIDIDKADGWHTLRVVMKGDRIECYYDGKKHIDIRDSTFKEAGKIGLWTKADAQTHFDDLTAGAPSEK